MRTWGSGAECGYGQGIRRYWKLRSRSQSLGTERRQVGRGFEGDGAGGRGAAGGEYTGCGCGCGGDIVGGYFVWGSIVGRL